MAEQQHATFADLDELKDAMERFALEIVRRRGDPHPNGDHPRTHEAVAALILAGAMHALVAKSGERDWIESVIGRLVKIN